MVDYLVVAKVEWLVDYLAAAKVEWMVDYLAETRAEKMVDHLAVMKVDSRADLMVVRLGDIQDQSSEDSFVPLHSGILSAPTIVQLSETSREIHLAMMELSSDDYLDSTLASG